MATRKGKFALLCIQMNTTSPFLTHILIGSYVQSLEYENLKLLFINCGLVGHLQDNCMDLPPTSPNSDTTNLTKAPLSTATTTSSQPIGTPWKVVHRKYVRKLNPKVSDPNSEKPKVSVGRINHFLPFEPAPLSNQMPP
ncbi:hypothetical protein ACH5RR_021497 [Cinchona calisaya]|uniref:Zinc knuckle CX2CX4HX4C domain-containing protein n=1 Tax=Cinchona calisaya TaxID=153742 RepID=A0ABD2ZHP6_9GENT